MAKKKMKAKPKTKAKAAAKPRKSAAKAAPRMKAKPAARKPAPRPKAKPVATKKAARKAALPAPAQPARSKALAAGSQWVNAHLVVRNMNAAIDYYSNAFGFTLRSKMAGPDGSLMHAELMHNDSLVMLGPENQQMGSFAPQGPSPVTLYVYVEDVDGVTQRSASLGGQVMMAPADMFWGDRCSMVVDPDGHRWMLATHIKDMTPDEMMEAMQASMPPEPPPAM